MKYCNFTLANRIMEKRGNIKSGVDETKVNKLSNDKLIVIHRLNQFYLSYVFLMYFLEQ